MALFCKITHQNILMLISDCPVNGFLSLSRMLCLMYFDMFDTLISQTSVAFD